ncbi:M20 metallopeptidase family protein [Helcococcus kunzii]|uniref:M20 metallopeptidase family protein n=1 Tax=Helcococcus kunzii TaxID=40091 RepID=UPI001BB00797|nr:M20 family metallopeptidase [Helcococcus kunzii]MCT1795802.1 M20 family metallopeptidase [Helcococcus kunzii]MCT1989381.1 M20 family metallopeptidase [Helcococcus kunzii]QUY65042.1 amidohydrolase [Helcococcus kunzii]QZO75751.1 amidohydrolase [Helcococcus kunzii]
MDSIKLAKENESLIIEIRRELHKIPELELELPKTVKFVKSKLDEWGISYVEMVNGNGLVALIEGAEEGECLAIRADMDALPVAEETGLEFASQHEGRMHACGHDSHTAIALVTAKIINENKDKIKGAVKFIFQPGEEIPGGAKPMIDEGALLNPKVDYFISLHNGKLADLGHGNIGFRENELMASMDKFSLKVTGRGGHGASPHLAIDPIAISAEIISGIQKIISREIAPVESGLISVCMIKGGSTQNIIPDQVEMLGTARALNEQTRDLIEKRIEEIAKGIAQSYGGDAELNYERKYPVLVNDPEFTQYVKSLTKNLFSDLVVDIPLPTMGSEDAAFYLQEVPGTYIFMDNIKPHKDGVCYLNHNSKFDLDESDFYKGVAIFLETAFNKLAKK